MIFGALPPAEALGATLAHSVVAGGRKLAKGTVLGEAELARLAAAGIEAVTVARAGEGDVGEDAAAARLAAALVPDPGRVHLRVAAPFTGRVNVFAEAAGVVRVDRAAIEAVNRLGPALTVATLPDWQRVAPGDMVATVKVIPYFVPGALVERAVAAAAGTVALALSPVALAEAGLILTATPGFAPRLLDKGRQAVEGRLAGLGLRLAGCETVPHAAGAVAAALGRARGDMVLVLGASATSDAGDVCPAGLVAAGGRLTRFGMPVDPGNLLFIGDLGGRPVIGLPGCARSPAMNGVDWVLERVACGLAVTGDDIAAMGVGGLLKEIPTRPQPRAFGKAPPRGPRRVVILLAAGAARRMRGEDKLLQPVAGGVPLIRHAAMAMRASDADAVIVVLGPGQAARRTALDGTGIGIVEAADAGEGMAASIRAGIRALPETAEAAVLAFADMPEVGPAHVNRLLAAFEPEEGREIVRACSSGGKPGHPVLFGRRFFESLAGLAGDEGARAVVAAAREHVADVTFDDDSVLVDLDTPEAWAAWRAGKARSASA